MSWSEFWESISVLQAALWVLGILGVIAFIVKGWPWLKRFIRLVDALGQLPDFITRTDKTLLDQDRKIAQIHHEVNYNDGGSVKDTVDRVELGVKGIYQRLDAADQDRADLREDLEHTHPAVARKRTTKPTQKEE